MTATSITPLKQSPDFGPSGGAATFLGFLREELIPFIDSTYRTVPGDRAIAGHSLGGLFIAYVLTHAPETFQKYSVGSPALWFDDEVWQKWEAEYAAAHRNLPARIYINYAEDDPHMITDSERRFCDKLRSHNYAGLDQLDLAVQRQPISPPIWRRSRKH